MPFDDALFDMIKGDAIPFAGFGPTDAAEGRKAEFLRLARQAGANVQEIFRRDVSDDDAAPRVLDEIIEEMWGQGWTPQENVGLFTRDLGAILAASIHRRLGGTLLFRPDLLHVSLWWESQALEVFPLHKTRKALLTRDGESVTQLDTAVRQRVEK